MHRTSGRPQARLSRRSLASEQLCLTPVLRPALAAREMLYAEPVGILRRGATQRSAGARIVNASVLLEYRIQ